MLGGLAEGRGGVASRPGSREDVVWPSKAPIIPSVLFSPVIMFGSVILFRACSCTHGHELADTTTRTKKHEPRQHTSGSNYNQPNKYNLATAIIKAD